MKKNQFESLSLLELFKLLDFCQKEEEWQEFEKIKFEIKEELRRRIPILKNIIK